MSEENTLIDKAGSCAGASAAVHVAGGDGESIHAEGMMGENEKPLVDVARVMMERTVQRDVTTSPSHAACYASGYDDGFAAAVIEGARSCTAEVNMVVAEKDASHREAISALERLMDKRDARIAELEAQLAARQVQGVVVDGPVIEAMRAILPNTGPSLLAQALTAALSSAKIVPLVSATAKWWRHRDDEYCVRLSVAHRTAFPSTQNIAEAPMVTIEALRDQALAAVEALRVEAKRVGSRLSAHSDLAAVAHIKDMWAFAIAARDAEGAMRVSRTISTKGDSVFYDDPTGTHVALPLDGPLDEAAVEKAANALRKTQQSDDKTTSWQDDARAAITAYLRAVGGGE